MTAPPAADRPEAVCPNCREIVKVDLAVHTAGTWSCRLCSELADAQMVTLQSWPGQPGNLHARRCRRCLVVRFGDAGSPTQCLICTNARTQPGREPWPLEELLPAGALVPPDRVQSRRRRLLATLIDGPSTVHRGLIVRTLSELHASWRRDDARHHYRWPRFVTDPVGLTQALTDDDHAREIHLRERAVAELNTRATLIGAWQLYERDDWRIVGAEQPGIRRGPGSGVWASHTGCGTLQQLTLHRKLTCRGCADAHAALLWRAQRHLLYLVHFRTAAGHGYCKIGIGVPNRVREHVRFGGGQVVQVVEASRAAVRRAELYLKKRHRGDIVGHRLPDLPWSAGEGTEVVADTVAVDLYAAIYAAGEWGEDVTEEYAPLYYS